MSLCLHGCAGFSTQVALHTDHSRQGQAAYYKKVERLEARAAAATQLALPPGTRKQRGATGPAVQGRRRGGWGARAGSQTFLAWARVLSAEFQRLRQEVRQGTPSVLDAYGATNPAEFFAVATESFFERPHQLRRKRPELYEELKQSYRQDPVRWNPDPELGPS